VKYLIMLRYLIGGFHVGDIAKDMGVDRPTIRRYLKEGGITMKPSIVGYSLGRDPVCFAVKGAGYASFYRFAEVRGLDPITEQADDLGISEEALSRVYNSYTRLLTWLKASGIDLPTPQASGATLERRSETGR